MDKAAVDSKTQDYWESYFGEYGKQWVRSIPRRIAAALAQRTASAGSAGSAGSTGSADSDGYQLLRMRPIGAPVILDTHVLVEGSCVLGNGSVRMARLFAASFDHDGRLLGLDAVPVPLN